MVDIIGYKKTFLGISFLLFLTSIFAISFWGLKLGIDFTGGSLMEIEYFVERPAAEDIRRSLQEFDIGSVVIQPTGEQGVILRFREVDEATHQRILAALREQVAADVEDPLLEKRFDTIGPTIGSELKRRSILALIFAMVAIIFYIAWAFRHVSKPVSSWKYGAVALATLLHDIAIPTGIFAALGRFQGVEIGTLFISALLTVIGYSIHDTIVVFDRIRENLKNLKTPEPFSVTVNRSVNQTISRSVNTTITVLFVLGAIFFFGGETTRYFSLALSLGIIFGTFSSIFVASPLLVIWNDFKRS